MYAIRSYYVSEAGGGREGLARLAESVPDAVLLDMRMPDMDGSAVLAEITAGRPGLPVVMLTAFGSVGAAVEAMKHGAYDYLTKPADNDELIAVLDRAHEYARLLRENAALKAGLPRGVITSYSIHYTKLYDFLPDRGGCRPRPGSRPNPGRGPRPRRP